MIKEPRGGTVNEMRNDLFLRSLDQGPRNEAAPTSKGTSGQASHLKQNDAFEKELRQARPKELSLRSKQKTEKRAEANANRSDNLWSQTGAGSEHLAPMPENRRAEDREQPAERFSEENRRRPSEKTSMSSSSHPVNSASSREREAENSESAASPGRDGSTGPAEKPLSEKQKSMKSFLDHMQSEFGVPPAKILQAFDQMDMKTLEAPPEDTAKVFIANLTGDAGLKPTQASRAAELYTDMLVSTGAADLDEKLSGVDLGGGDPADENIANVMRSLQNSLNQSMDDLSKAFGGKSQPTQVSALTPPLSPEEMQGELAKINQLIAAQKRGETGNQTAGESEKNKAALLSALAALEAKMAGGVQVKSSRESGISSASQPGLNGTSLIDASDSGDESLIGPGGNISALAIGTGEAGKQMGSQGSLSGDSGDNARQGANQSFAQEAGGLLAGSATTGSAKGKVSSKEEMAKALKEASSAPGSANVTAGKSTFGIGESAEAVAGLNPGGAGKSAGAVNLAPGATQPLAVKMSAEDREANLKELVQQAKLVVKKGGGEMNLELRPEGIGHVHLKVNVENGQVNVQMMTENESAKKMLQDSLHELKASLAAHKLSVDSMRVDTKVDASADVRKHMDQQTNQDASREQAKQFAQDFMQQFRDEREGLNNGRFDSANFRSYGRSVKRAELEPSQLTAASLRRADGARRLNLMA